MVYGETGRYPLSLSLKSKMIMYWAKVLTAKDFKLTNVNYCYFHRCNKNGSFIHPLIKCVLDILSSYGLSSILENQTICGYNWL